MIKRFYLWRMQAASDRMDRACLALPKGWTDNPEEAVEEIVELVRASNKFQYWSKKTRPTNK